MDEIESYRKITLEYSSCMGEFNERMKLFSSMMDDMFYLNKGVNTNEQTDLSS